MSDQDIARCRAQAEECRREAERSSRPARSGSVAALGWRMDQDEARSREAARRTLNFKLKTFRAGAVEPREATALCSGHGLAPSLRLHRTMPANEGGAAPSGPDWVHEIKHDGYRLMVRRDGSRVRCFTRNGNDWANRFPAIVDAALGIKATSYRAAARGTRRRDARLPCAAEPTTGP